MDILYSLSEKEPGLKPELAAAIEYRISIARSIIRFKESFRKTIEQDLPRKTW